MVAVLLLTLPDRGAASLYVLVQVAGWRQRAASTHCVCACAVWREPEVDLAATAGGGEESVGLGGL